jgi:hypothetical protein
MLNARRGEAVAMADPAHSARRRLVDPEQLALRELARRQGVRPVESADDLAADAVFDSDEELDEFLAAVAAWRRADVG